MNRRWPVAVLAGALAFASFAGEGSARSGADDDPAFDPNWLSDGDEIPVQRRWNLRSANTFRHATADFDLELILQNIDGEVIDFYNSPDRNQINISDRRVVLQASLRFH